MSYCVKNKKAATKKCPTVLLKRISTEQLAKYVKSANSSELTVYNNMNNGRKPESVPDSDHFENLNLDNQTGVFNLFYTLTGIAIENDSRTSDEVGKEIPEVAITSKNMDRVAQVAQKKLYVAQNMNETLYQTFNTLPPNNLDRKSKRKRPIEKQTFERHAFDVVYENRNKLPLIKFQTTDTSIKTLVSVKIREREQDGKIHLIYCIMPSGTLNFNLHIDLCSLDLSSNYVKAFKSRCKEEFGPSCDRKKAVANTKFIGKRSKIELKKTQPLRCDSIANMVRDSNNAPDVRKDSLEIGDIISMDTEVNTMLLLNLVENNSNDRNASHTYHADLQHMPHATSLSDIDTSFNDQNCEALNEETPVVIVFSDTCDSPSVLASEYELNKNRFNHPEIVERGLDMPSLDPDDDENTYIPENSLLLHSANIEAAAGQQTMHHIPETVVRGLDMPSLDFEEDINNNMFGKSQLLHLDNTGRSTERSSKFNSMKENKLTENHINEANVLDGDLPSLDFVDEPNDSNFECVAASSLKSVSNEADHDNINKIPETVMNCPKMSSVFLNEDHNNNVFFEKSQLWHLPGMMTPTKSNIRSDSSRLDQQPKNNVPEAVVCCENENENISGKLYSADIESRADRNLNSDSHKADEELNKNGPETDVRSVRSFDVDNNSNDYIFETPHLFQSPNPRATIERVLLNSSEENLQNQKIQNDQTSQNEGKEQIEEIYDVLDLCWDDSLLFDDFDLLVKCPQENSLESKNTIANLQEKCTPENVKHTADKRSAGQQGPASRSNSTDTEVEHATDSYKIPKMNEKKMSKEFVVEKDMKNSMGAKTANKNNSSRKILKSVSLMKIRKISKLFGSPCLSYLAGTCARAKCRYSHILSDPIYIESKLSALSPEKLYSEVHLYIASNPKLFHQYFPLLCHVLGIKKSVRILKLLSADLQTHNFPDSCNYLKNILQALIAAGLQRNEAIATMLEVYDRSNHRHADVIADLILEDDSLPPLPFMAELDKIMWLPNFEFQINALIRMMEFCNAFKPLSLVKTVMFAVSRLSQPHLKEISSLQCIKEFRRSTSLIDI